MTLPRPTLDVPAKGAFDQGEVTIDQLESALSLSIPNTAELPSNGRAYAFILLQRTDDPETPLWSGEKTHATDTGEWRVPPGNEPEDGDFYRRINLQLQIPKAPLAEHVGETLFVGYSALANESGMVMSSPTIELLIK